MIGNVQPKRAKPTENCSCH